MDGRRWDVNVTIQYVRASMAIFIMSDAGVNRVGNGFLRFLNFTPIQRRAKCRISSRISAGVWEAGLFMLTWILV